MWSPVTPHMPGAQPDTNEQKPETDTTTLYLVDPQGNRYTIATFGTEDESAPELIDWSGDGSHALLGAKYPAPAKVVSIDLHTGAQTTLPVDGYPATRILTANRCWWRTTTTPTPMSRER